MVASQIGKVFLSQTEPWMAFGRAMAGLWPGLFATILGAAAGLTVDALTGGISAGNLIAAAIFLLVGIAVTFGGEWFHTKDAASMDEDGYIWYEGRADDVIISAGYRIGPFEVESACLEHPAVAEAAAVAWPDERRGNVVKAFVVPAAGHEPSDDLGEEISAFVREHLSAYAYPRIVEFVDDLPKTLTGKIRRIELRERSKA